MAKARKVARRLFRNFRIETGESRKEKQRNNQPYKELDRRRKLAYQMPLIFLE